MYEIMYLKNGTHWFEGIRDGNDPLSRIVEITKEGGVIYSVRHNVLPESVVKNDEPKKVQMSLFESDLF